ncbi:MAG: glycosyltransferase family 1 protein [Chloroflexi bacterium]|nr:glycosyltransferase family 1 protein [Chloroflexota bacterium]
MNVTSDPVATAAPRRLRVGFLTYGLDRPLSGVTRVALELGKALQQGGECEVVYLTTYRDGPFTDGPPGSHWRLPGCSLLPQLMALGGPMIAYAARRFRLDVVHDPIGVGPFTLGRWSGAYKRLMTLHDAIAYRYPEGYPWLNNFLHRRYIPATIGNCDAVFTDSEDARRDIVHFFRQPAERTFVVPLGVSSDFRPAAPDLARATALRYGLTGPFVLSVGAQQERKNVARLLEAFRILHERRPEYRLAIAGPTMWRTSGLGERVKELGLEEAVVTLGYLPEADLPAIYSAASLFVFPSLYEGFGLPVLEAMACGAPVVCSDATSLPEVAGDAALMVNARSTEEIAAAMDRALGDPALLSDLRRRGLQRAAEFTWERVAHETVAIYRGVVAGGAAMPAAVTRTR